MSTFIIDLPDLRNRTYQFTWVTRKNLDSNALVSEKQWRRQLALLSEIKNHYKLIVLSLLFYSSTNFPKFNNSFKMSHICFRKLIHFYVLARKKVPLPYAFVEETLIQRCIFFILTKYPATPTSVCKGFCLCNNGASGKPISFSGPDTCILTKTCIHL